MKKWVAEKIMYFDKKFTFLYHNSQVSHFGRGHKKSLGREKNEMYAINCYSHKFYAKCKISDLKKGLEMSMSNFTSFLGYHFPCS